MKKASDSSLHSWLVAGALSLVIAAVGFKHVYGAEEVDADVPEAPVVVEDSGWFDWIPEGVKHPIVTTKELITNEKELRAEIAKLFSQVKPLQDKVLANDGLLEAAHAETKRTQEHFEKILEDSQREVERLKGQNSEYWDALTALEVKASGLRYIAGCFIPVEP